MYYYIVQLIQVHWKFIKINYKPIKIMIEVKQVVKLNIFENFLTYNNKTISLLFIFLNKLSKHKVTTK